MRLPLTVTMMLTMVVTATHRRLPPVVAARTVTIILAVVAAAAVPTLWIVSLGYVAHLPCSRWIGAAALLMSIAGIVRARTGVQALSPPAPQPPGTVEITDHDQTFAFTLPGRGGQVVLSTGLIDMLDEAEQQVVLAHERAHAHHRHDRYLLTAQLAAAVIPLLRRLAGRLQFSLERWADETAVARCGDRGFVARTLGKVALRRITPAGAAFERGIVPGSGTPAPLPEAGRLTELSADDF